VFLQKFKTVIPVVGPFVCCLYKCKLVFVTRTLLVSHVIQVKNSRFAFRGKIILRIVRGKKISLMNFFLESRNFQFCAVEML